MAEKIYWQDASFSVTSSRLVHDGATYPIAAVIAVQVEPLPPDQRVYTRLLLGTPAFLWGALFLVLGADSDITWSMMLGLGLAIAGGIAIGFGVKVLVEDRRLRNVRVSLASGENVLVAAPRDLAPAIADAVAAAIASRESGDSLSE